MSLFTWINIKPKGGLGPAVIQLTPTKTWRRGDFIQKTQLRRGNDGWLFGLPQRETYELAACLHELPDIIEPFKDAIGKAVDQFSLKKEVSFGVYLRGEAPGAWFTADTLRRLAALRVDVDIDFILLS